MSISSQLAQSEIVSFCEHCSQGLDGLTSHKARIDFVKAELPGLLKNKDLCVSLLTSVIEGKGYPDIHRPTMFDNEVLLYLHPLGHFSLRMYLWGPGEYTYPHDHNSWGVIGTVSEGYEVVNYRREDDETIEGYAKLVEIETLRLQPGETAFTLPLSKGIHKTGNATGESIITFHLYGKSMPRGYLNCFDIARNGVRRVFPPRRRKELLARQALSCLLNNEP